MLCVCVYICIYTYFVQLRFRAEDILEETYFNRMAFKTTIYGL